MKISVTGVPEVLAKLHKLGFGKIKKALRKGTRAAAKIIAEGVIASWPTVTGKSISEVKVRSLPRSRTRVGTSMRMWVRTGSAPYIAFVELGTRRMTKRGVIKRIATERQRSVIRLVLEAMETVANES